jgi:Flp pilus assembly protein TadG
MPPPNRSSDRPRERAGLLRDDEGSAALEFVFVGLLLLVPVVYLVVALGQIQGQTLGAEAGARHIARAVATAEHADDAETRADGILASVVEQYGIDPDAVDVTVTCTDGAGPCPRAGTTVLVTVRTRVALPLVPPILDLDRLASIPIEAGSAQKVSRFWSDG